MLKFISKLFYYKECDKLKTILEKLYCIKNNLVMTPYTGSFPFIELAMLEGDIVTYTETLSKMIKADLNTRIAVKRITEDSLKSVTFSEWFTDDDNLLDNTDEYWNTFILVAIELCLWYNMASKRQSDIIPYSNSIKIRPYIINLESLVDALIDSQ